MKGKTMQLKMGRYDHLTHEEAIALLRALEGPLLELVLSGGSFDVGAGDVFGETFHSLAFDPRVQLIFPTEEECDLWEAFRLERGDGPAEIGEFVYGPDENPWR